jgi:hypothetical protein
MKKRKIISIDKSTSITNDKREKQELFLVNSNRRRRFIQIIS